MNLIDWIYNTLIYLDEKAGSFVWGIPMILLMLVTGIILSTGTRFFQIRYASHWIKSSIGSVFSKKSLSRTCKDHSGISQFQALCTALASTIGTGNIAGVSTAIAIGGPGAVMWMWVSAFFGMMTAYSENVLGIYYRRKGTDGQWSGGPMYYIRDGLGSKKYCGFISRSLAFLFCIFCIFASFGMGNMAQVNSISSVMKSDFGFSPLACGIALAVVAAFVIVGGIKRIGSITEKLVPAMALFYIAGALIIFFMNYRQIPYVFASIFKNAFSLSSAFGAATGLMLKKSISMGFKRGIFSNEAGLGSAVIVHSASDVKEPAVQGMWGIFAVFFDTIVVCTLTAFVLLSATCPTTSLGDALSGISKEPRYVSLYEGKNSNDSIHLMDYNTNTTYLPSAASDSEASVYTVTPSDGIPFEISIKKAEDCERNHTYTNIMSVRGISLDAGGNVISDPSAHINAVCFEEVEGVPLVTYAFSQKFGSWAGKIIAVAIFLFAFSTVIGWSYYGCKAWEYIFGTRAMIIYKIVYVLFIVVGAVLNLKVVWSVSDTFNGLMAIPNLIAVLALSGTVFKITKNYTDRKFKGVRQKPMLSAFADIQQKQHQSMKADGEI